MPINPNIALGVQQQQPVNMLGQMGQMLALKGAVQEMQGNEDLRAAYSQGGDLNDPEFRRRVMAANPKLGSQLIKTNAETGKLQNEAIANRIKLSREMLTGVNSPEDYIAWHESNHKDPVLGSYLTQRGVTAEQSRAKIIADLAKPGGLDKLKRESALGATDLQKELMQTERTRISSGAGYQQAALAREKYKDQLAAGGDIITSLVKDPETGQDVEMQFRRNLRTGDFEPVVLQPPSTRVEVSPSSASSSFAPSGAGDGAPNVNALTTQGGAAAAPNVNALTQAPTFGRPKVPFTTPVAVMKDGKPVLVQGREAIGMTPATAFTERQAAGKVETVRSLNTAISNLTDAIKPGGLLEKSTGSGFGRMVDASAAFVGKATEGAKAAASLAPIADLVLKMVPRFEGPQSDKDTQSYKEAAGQLADSGLPNETRKDAAKVILRLMKERKDQFGMSDQVGGSGAGGAPSDPLGIR
jgi:hypothetical protein